MRRIRERYVVEPATGCWLYRDLEATGLPIIWADGMARRVYRVTYEDLYGVPVPKGISLRHIGGSRKTCVNPRHRIIERRKSV